MDFLFYLPLIISLVAGSSLKIINNKGKCLVYTDDSHGCTGHSAPFAQLDGNDCSRFILDGKETDSDKVKVDICGTKDGKQLAWITVNRDHTATFLNQQGDTFTCTLDNDFKVGSGCESPDTSSTRVSTTGQSALASSSVGESTTATSSATSVGQASSQASNQACICSCIPVIVQT